jgi:uncharacterized protein (DUF1330 family)
MAAFMIVEMRVLDAELMTQYRAVAAPSMKHRGGEFLVRGGSVEQVEGDRPRDEQVVVVMFPNMDAARTWYASPEYAKALAVSKDAMTRRVTFVEGIAAQP